MRLLKLKLKNIASLKNEHVIDFEAISNASALFAITGETGAGKSSILNSIGLALYGQIYKKNVNQMDVVTLGEKEGHIELIFQVAGVNYIADWKAKVRKQSGELLKQPLTQRIIQPLDGSEFESMRGVPVESVEKLLNLDFDQFCKCIILNQGEFARFLSSSFTERKEILDKLYPGEILDNLGRELKTQLDQYLRSVSDLEVELGALQSDGQNGDDLKLKKSQLQRDLNHHESWHQKIETLSYHFTSLLSHYEQFCVAQQKSLAIREDLKNATTSYNLLLKESEGHLDKYQSAKIHQERELPRLHELLKVEEALKNAKDQLTTVTKKRMESEAIKLQHENKKSLLDTSYSQWQKSHEGLLQGLHSPLQILKVKGPKLEKLFDLHAEQEHLVLAQGSGQEKLKALETQGKDLNVSLQDILQKISRIDADVDPQILILEKKKSDHQKMWELRSRLELKHEELKGQILKHREEQTEVMARISKIKEALNKGQIDFLATETSLKLQEFKQAVTVTLAHAHQANLDQCPVCASSIPLSKWQDLMSGLERTDHQSLQERFHELTKALITLQEDLKTQEILKLNLYEGLKNKENEINELAQKLKDPLEDLGELEEKLKKLHQDSWELDRLKKEELKVSTELNRIRGLYAEARSKVQEQVQQSQDKELQMNLLLEELKELIPQEMDSHVIKILKEDYRRLTQLVHSENEGAQIKQEILFLVTTLEKETKELSAFTLEEASLQDKIKEMNERLGPLRPQELIAGLNQSLKELTFQWTQAEAHLKKQELALKELQSRLYTLDEHLKDLDLHFTKELHCLQSEAKACPPSIGTEMDTLNLTFASLGLSLRSEASLFIPLKDALTNKKEEIKNLVNGLRTNLATVTTRLEDWEKRQDKILLNEIKRQDLKSKIARHQRLFEILGKDELRSFVLSLVEENLISQTNQELQKLCHGRYEIVHQTGRNRTPEFYVLDKFREGESRKVSTLSGGETFMVSLAMALALAEMTRGQAEIDSLFIDEGFGTLDQESLEDVLDMLQQIQTRGLMVGVISHIKALTNALPVNLVLSKKHDGTSTVGMLFN